MKKIKHGISFVFNIINKNNYKDEYTNNVLNKKDINSFKYIPCDKNIFEAFFISEIFNLNKKKEDLLGAILIKWIRDKYAKVIKYNKKKLFGNSKEIIAIDLTNMPNYQFENYYEKELYEMMFNASLDGILEEHELKKWCNNNYSKFFKWFDKVKQDINRQHINDGDIAVLKTGKLFQHDIYTINDKLCDEAKKLYGLKKYLLEFTKLDKKEFIDVKLWQDYLIFAQIFGISSEVLKQFNNLYPELINSNKSYLNYNDILWVNTITKSGINSALLARNGAK